MAPPPRLGDSAVCKPDGLYNCDKIDSRDEYLKNKDNLIDNCDNCFPNGMYWCPVSGEPVQITDKARWDQIVKVDTPGNLVSKPEDCSGYFPDKGKYYCVEKAQSGNPAYNCGQINTKSDYDKFITEQGGTVMDNCDDCFPKGKSYCDPDSGYDCGPVNNRADWQKYKDKLADNCDDCYPKDKYVCDKKTNCDQIDTLRMWRMNKDRPYYDTKGECIKNCDKKQVEFPWGLYILLLVFFVVYIVSGVIVSKK